MNLTKKISTVARLLLCVLLVFSIAAPTGSYIARAEAEGGTVPEVVDVNAKVNYGQTSARSMLDMINAFRTSTTGADAPDGAWYWQADDATKTVYNTDDSNMLQPLVYDYDLEKAAMQRAAEIALHYDGSHKRPDGRSCFSVLDDLGIDDNYTGNGENIAAGTASIDANTAYLLWREDNDKYADQGHRRNMLNPNFNAVGIAKVTVNGYDYWVQEFGRTAQTTAETPANDELTDVTLKVSSSELVYDSTGTTSFDNAMTYGETQKVPEVYANVRTSKTFGNGMNVVIPVTWESSVPSVADVEDGVIKTKAVGSTVLSTSFEPVVTPDEDVATEFSLELSVEPIDISAMDITLEYGEIEYTGKEMKPEITAMTLSGEEFVPDSPTDITVSYSDNVQVGTGKVSVTGSRIYKGTATREFTIKECQHVFDEGTVVSDADCTSTGTKKFECTKCDQSKTETIPAKGHTPGAAATCTTDQTCTVCKAVIKPRLGHTPTAGTFDCTKDQTCSVCKEVYHKAGSHTPGAAATCTADQTCTVCKAIIKQAEGHTPNAAAPTCSTDQICTVCKEVLKKATGVHTAGAAATCSNPQKCTVCGTVMTKATGNHVDANNDTKCDVCAKDLSNKGPITGEMIRSSLPVIIAFVLLIASAVTIVVVYSQQHRRAARGRRR